jgi:SAM-dependent methyltransferase
VAIPARRQPLRERPWMHAGLFAFVATCAMQAEAQVQGAAGFAGAKGREDCERQFKPQSGQAGKDVVWVPTNDGLVRRMLEMAAVTDADLVYDLGAGDGKIAIAAAKQFGARAVGVEFNPDMARLAQCMVRSEGVSERVKILQGDIFDTDFSDATVVTLYLLPELNLRLRPTLLKMKPGTRVVSHSFMMEDWEPDQRASSEDGYAYLWIVPAQVAGSWTFREENGKDRFNVQLEQTFQQLSGTLDGKQPLTAASMHGKQIQLSFDRNEVPVAVIGRVDGDRIEARVMRDKVASNYIGTRQ